MKCGLIREVVASLEWDILVVFYYLSASEIWSDKRVGLWWEWLYKIETTVNIIKHNLLLMFLSALAIYY